MASGNKTDVDHDFLCALLKDNNLSTSEQLSLTMTWNRADIARSVIFDTNQQELPKSVLHNAMLEALIHNRAEFVRLLLEKGVNMHEFLTIGCLEELYNTDKGPPNTLYYIVRDVVRIRAGYRYKLPHIGMAIEKLMANGFRSHYTSSHFREKYNEYRGKLKEFQRLNTTSDNHLEHNHNNPPSSYPRCGSEFFARNASKRLPSSQSDTRLSGSINKHSSAQIANPRNKTNAAVDSRTTGRIGSPPGVESDKATGINTNKNTASFSQIPAICGSRTLSSHILWRSLARRDNMHQLNAAPPFSARGQPQQQHQHFRTSSAHQFAAHNFPSNDINIFPLVDEIGYGANEEKFSDVKVEKQFYDFRYPFSDLLIWAVLTKRHEMALCMWKLGEEAMAKSLISCHLYKRLAKEAAEDYLELEVCEELKKYAEEFRQLSLELLDHCYKRDDAQTLQLLTYELEYWGQETCLSLAVIVNNKQFLAHPCCQILLADLWHGGLRIRSNSNLKVILGILFPPSIFLLEFKSREELMLQPQTAAEHQDDINDSSSSSESVSSSSSSESGSEEVDSDYDLSEKTGGGGGLSLSERRRRVSSRGSMQSLNFASIFHSKRKRHRDRLNASTDGGGGTVQDLESGKAKTQEETVAPRRSRSNAREARTKTRIRAERQRELNAASSGNNVPLSPVIQSSFEDSPPIPAESSDRQNPTETSPPLKPALKSTIPVTPLHVDINAYRRHQKGLLQFTIGNDESGKEEKTKRSSTSSTTTTSEEPKSSPVEKVHFNNAADAQFDHQDSFDQAKSTSNRWKFLRNIGPGLSKEKLVEEYTNNRLTIDGGHVPKGIPLPEGVTLNKKRQIKFRRKLYEFFVAPITTFWAWMLSFVVFLCTLTYVLLIRTPLRPTALEWYLLAYVVAFGIETVRKFLMSEPKKFGEKVQYFFGNYWNFLTTAAIFGFIIGFLFRLNPSTSRNVGRIILAVDSVLWTVKLLDFLGVFPRFGPYITMAGKMIMNMSSIVVMLGISLLGFGLARQSITYPNEEWHWLLLRNVFYKPYFMLYGEVYADEIDTCGDEAWDEHLDKNISIADAWAHRDNRDKELACVPGHWIPPILMTVFLLIANILLVSMLIAIFNNIFDSTIKISQQIWLFQRYRQVMEYEATPFLPPPFTPIYHVYMVFKYLNYRKCCCFPYVMDHMLNRDLCQCFRCRRNEVKEEKEEGNGEKEKKAVPAVAENASELRQKLQAIKGNKERLALFDFALKLFLTDEQVEKIHEFEGECMENLAGEKESARIRSNEERLLRTCERTESILLQVNDLASRVTMLKELETRIERIEANQPEILECLRQMNSVMPQLTQLLQLLPLQQ